MFALPAYAELVCRSSFSFLTGASSPEALVERACALRYAALAITDECSMSGVVHAHERAQSRGLHLIVGAEMRLEPSKGAAPMRLVLLATSRRGFGNLSQWITVARRRAQKGRYQAFTSDLEGWIPSMPHLAGLPECLALLLPTAGPVPAPDDAGTGSSSLSGVTSAAATAGGRGGSPSSPRPPVTGQEVIALASARAAASLAARTPGIGRPRGRESRLGREGPVSAEGPPDRTRPGAAQARGDPAPKLRPRPARARLPPRPTTVRSFETLLAQAQWVKAWFGVERAWLAMPLLMQGEDDEIRARVRKVAAMAGLRIAAVGDVLMANRASKPLQDMLTATRLRRPIADCGHALPPNAEAHLRARSRLQSQYEADWLAETVAIAGRCTFSLDELRYEYPREIVPEGHTPASWLRALTEKGALRRFPEGVPAQARELIEHELALIARLTYEPYFLTVADVVQWARSQGILCQGRGSAANSVVCYCLGVTEVDPALHSMLFERFISEERNEPPDIDIDFEHQRREEVIQYIYQKYGRHRAAMTGVVIRYRLRSAVRDAGRALGVNLDRIDAVTRALHAVGGPAAADAAQRLATVLAEHGFDPASRQGAQWIGLSLQLRDHPRHLSQHPGGLVIARDDVSRLVPVENAAMDDRTVIQWDKDDLDVLGLIKVDVLALGMLSALRRALVFVEAKRRGAMPAAGIPAAGGDGFSSGFLLQDIPKEDPSVYAMLQAGDSIGVFQVESRAQMSMLPRLRPSNFYDLVIEVAIVRPGPIQGGMVHPYLRRRDQTEPVTYPSPEVKEALGRTLGVPIFQEQVMQLAILAADFTPGEADQLRRAMAAWKRRGGLGPFHDKLTTRMVAKGYELAYAEAIFRQIEGFGEYGFPESHAASFALLVYFSAWIKRHHPDAFLAALLNSQPMGFYAPAQLVRDARAHGVVLRPVDILRSERDSTLEPLDTPPTACESRFVPPGQWAVRLGLGRVAGLSDEQADRIVAARMDKPFVDVEDLARRAELDARALECLAQADTLGALAGDRRAATWAVSGVDTRAAALLKSTRTHEPGQPMLDPLALSDHVLADYQTIGLSLTSHPVALLRTELTRFKVTCADALDAAARPGQLVRASGLVTHRQQPGTAKGVIFVTLEDETGVVNVIVWPAVAAAQRRTLLAASLLTVYGVWQREGEVRHLIARTLVDHTPLLRGLAARSRDFH